MPVSKVLVNDTVRIKVKFVDTDPVTQEQTEVSPIAVAVVVLNSSQEQVASANATQITSSEYYYNFSTSIAGEYTVTFTGTLANSTFITVSQQLYVSSLTEEYKPSVTLRSDETISFAPDIAPLYLDPEELLRIFPDATLLEIGELIHSYSHEVNQLYGITQLPGTEEDPLAKISDVTGVTYTVIDYIRASVACELSRTYGFGGDDELTVQLGDLSITNKNLPRSDITRANATTWCQVAAALRKEILSKRVGIRGIQPKGLPRRVVTPSGASLDPQTGALIYVNDAAVYGPRDMFRPGVTTQADTEDPMPDRGIKRYD